mmetsp:Transcript_28919/g.86093  ORF Transcript_28919/g.86093 Transcript_28919/m.86093 type:complete len:204 (+) Transcript_28919:200-811(+)
MHARIAAASQRGLLAARCVAPRFVRAVAVAACAVGRGVTSPADAGCRCRRRRSPRAATWGIRGPAPHGRPRPSAWPFARRRRAPCRRCATTLRCASSARHPRFARSRFTLPAAAAAAAPCCRVALPGACSGSYRHAPRFASSRRGIAVFAHRVYRRAARDPCRCDVAAGCRPAGCGGGGCAARGVPHLGGDVAQAVRRAGRCR